MPQPPASAVRTLRAPKSPLERANAALGPLSNGPVNPVSAGPVAARPVVAGAPPKPPADEPQELNIQGPRKLVRPTLPPRSLRDRRPIRREEPVLQWHSGAPTTSSSHDSSHAESFYFQKQMQTQTPMVFVLEDGEKIEGCIEWYDRNAIKVRCSPVHTGVYSGPPASARPGDGVTRALVYKTSIKYLYKVGENQS